MTRSMKKCNVLHMRARREQPLRLSRSIQPRAHGLEVGSDTQLSEACRLLVLIRKEERRGQGPRRISIPKIKVDSRNQRVDLQNPG